jgi:polyisoprenoid-binding protein YceI
MKRFIRTALTLSLVALLAPGTFATERPVVPVGTRVAKAQTYQVNAEQSTVTWTAKKVTGSHYGTVQVSKGTLTVDGKKLTGGTVEVDLRTMISEDLKGQQGHDRLIGHLKSDDFFSVEKHPTATFVLTGVTPKGGNQVEVAGKLTIKGITQPVTFPATLTVNGNTLEATGKMPIDRTKYEMKFRSGSFFQNLGDKMIDDEFTLDLKIVASKSAV